MRVSVCAGTMLESTATQEAECLENNYYGCNQSDHPTHPPLPQPPTSDNVYNATYEPTPLGGHEYEVVDELRENNRGKTTGEVAVEEVERKKKQEEKDEEEEEEEKEEEKEKKEEGNSTTGKL